MLCCESDLSCAVPLRVSGRGGLGGTGGVGHGKERSKGGNDTLSLRFCYLPELGIVAVCPSPGWPASLLVNLFPNDTGRKTPNAANHHGRAARASANGIFEFPADVSCRPYRWAQCLAGLHFPPGNGNATPVALEPSTRAVVAALRSRAQTHISLSSQLKAVAEHGPVALACFQDKLPKPNGNVELRRYLARLVVVEFMGACRVFPWPFGLRHGMRRSSESS